MSQRSSPEFQHHAARVREVYLMMLEESGGILPITDTTKGLIIQGGQAFEDFIADATMTVMMALGLDLARNGEHGTYARIIEAGAQSFASLPGIRGDVPEPETN